jgi:hypothetical protein
MYFYLYDTFLNDSKYDKVLDQIKTRLLDLDIKGKHERLSLLKNIDSMITDEVKRGSRTIIVVGNDKTFLKAIDTVAKNEATIGIIPIGENNLIAKMLGVPEGEAACDILAARKIAEFDLGQVNNLYFFSNLKVRKNIDRISVSHQGYRVVPKPKCSEVGIYNFLITGDEVYDRALDKIDPQDRLLDLVIKSAEKPSGFKGFFQKNQIEKVDGIIQGVNFEVKSFEYLPLMVDDYRMVKTPVTVKMADKKLRVIIGKTKKLLIK